MNAILSLSHDVGRVLMPLPVSASFSQILLITRSQFISKVVLDKEKQRADIGAEYFILQN